MSYTPGAPNDRGGVALAITYSFRAENDVVYTKDKQPLNIKTLDLDKFYIGKMLPIIYYRDNPEYSLLDYGNSEVRGGGRD